MGGLWKQWLEVPDTGQQLGICVVGAAAAPGFLSYCPHDPAVRLTLSRTLLSGPGVCDL